MRRGGTLDGTGARPALAARLGLLAALGDVDRQHDQRRRTARVGRPQLDADAVPQRQAADHEQTHATGDRDVHRRRAGQPLVDRGQVLGGQADTGVVDLDQDAAVGQRVTGDLDLGLGGGERGGVLQQLGEQVHEVVDDPAGDLGLRHGAQFDALVLLHLGRGGAQHVDQRDRARPAAARLLAREDEEVLTVTAHTGGEVVQLEQRGQLVRVGLAGLQFGDERELTLDEALAAAREVGEHRVDVAPQQRLLGRQPDGFAVHVVEGRGHLADLVPAVHADGLHGGVHVLRVRLGQLLDQLGQALLGDLLRGVLEPAQRAHHGPGHDERADQRDAEDQQDQRTAEDGLLRRLVAQLAGLLLHLREQRALDTAHLVDLDGVRVVPVEVLVVLAVDAAVAGEGAVREGDGRLDVVVVAVQALGEVGGAGVDLREAVAGRLLVVLGGTAGQPVVGGELRAALVREAGTDQRALHRRVFLGGGERRERTGAADHLRVAGRLRHVLGEREQRGDQLVVAADRTGGVVAVLVRVVADLVEGVQLAPDVQQGRLHTGHRRVVALDVTGGLVERLLGPVGRLTRGDDAGVVLDVAGAGDRARRLVPLRLEGVGQLGGLPRHLGEQLHLVELVDVLQRRVDAHAAQRGRGDDGEREQGDQAGADAPVAHGYSRAGAARLLGALRRLGRGAVGGVTPGRRAGALAMLGRGGAVASAAQLRVRRSFPLALAGLGRPVPLETSLH